MAANQILSLINKVVFEIIFWENVKNFIFTGTYISTFLLKSGVNNL